MKSIYEYMDYRLYLKDVLAWKKKENPSFSHRMILSKMKVSSSGFLCNVINSKSNLTIKHIEQLSSILRLSTIEANYFKLLLYFSKAKTLSEKNDFFQQIIKYRKRKNKFLKDEYLTLFSKWYYPVIRELITYVEFNGDFSLLARKVEPPIRAYEAKEAVKTLLELGLIEVDSKGLYQQSETSLTTGDEVKSLHVANYQMKMIDLSKRAIEKVSPEKRDISGVTLSISQGKFELLKQEFQKFRKKIVQIAVDDDIISDKVVRCNLQLFPLSREVEDE